MKTLEDFQKAVARKYGLGSKLVTGHLKKYYDEAAIEYCKYSVQAALEEASNKAYAMGEGTGGLNTLNKNLYWTYAGNIGNVIINKDSILNAYPLSLIK